MLRKWGMIALILLASPALVFAQNTGKLQGVVTDADTGDPLPGASVLLVGTTQGTITDVDGNYFIIGVPVGSHDVQASFVGYQTQTRTGVDVSQGYTQVVDFALPAGVELDEIIIEYERPLIQQDAIGVPKIVDSEQIVNLPVRGTQNLAKIQAGVVAAEGSGTLYIRGGRSSEVTYYIDGVKVFGANVLPQSAVQEQEMLIGSISARYGDAMSGIINITTKSGSANFFGSFEGITSEAFDDFGYNLLSGAIGGPVGSQKLNFFLSAEFLDLADDNPRAYGQLRVNDTVLDDIHDSPTAFRVSDEAGNNALLPIPATLSDGAYLRMNSDGDVDTSDGFITFINGDTGEVDTQIAIAEGQTISNLTPANRSLLLKEGDYKVEDVKRKNAQRRIALNGNLTFNVLDNARVRVGSRFYSNEGDGNPGVSDIVFNNRESTLFTNNDLALFATWTHYLSNNTFYQLQVDYTDARDESWDPDFGKSRNDLFRYSDVDGEAEFESLRGYKFITYETQQIADSDGDLHDVEVPVFNNTYSDGQGLSDGVVYNLVQTAGREFNGYSKNRSEQFRFSASATTQIGLHQLEFGGEYEKRTFRGFSIGSGLSRYYNDGFAELAANDSRLNPDGYTDFYDMPIWLVANLTGSRGYDIWGDKETNGESLEGLIDNNTDENGIPTKPASDYNVAPYEPIFYGGYVQDKIEFRDIVLNLGLRVDVFDNNQRVLIDQFARRPVERVGDYEGSLTIPSNMGDDYVIYYSGNDIVGFRSVEGNFYNASGGPANAGDISLNGKPNQLDNKIRESMFKDYDPAVTLMPRIGVSFPVTDQALFFASYGVVAQRPSAGVDASLSSLTGTGGINNSGLQPEKTTSYELGFRQRLGSRMAFTISGFFKQVENLIQNRELRFATPSVYSSEQNVDFGTIKGVEFGFDVRRTGGFSANVNYTLSYADGTGSSSGTTGTIIWVSETPPNFISPLNFDQRHNLNVSLDYRLGQGEGPTILGGKLLQNTGINVLFTAKSGFPYTGVNEPENLAGGAKAEAPRGTINGDYSPGQSRVDLRIDRRFTVGSANLSAFIWVQNLFDQTNINNVWRYTGLPDDDGFLATPAGISMIQGSTNPTWNRDLYHHRNRALGNVGIPRLTRIGIRLDF